MELLVLLIREGAEPEDGGVQDVASKEVAIA